MKRLPQDLRKELKVFAVSQMALVREYEQKRQFETAYLARWAIAERFVKVVTTEYRRERLRRVLGEWLDYLDRKEDRQPQDKPVTALETRNLPKESEFKQSLSHFGYECEEIWSVMESKGKAREFRNQIAHTGRKFTRQSQYEKLSAQVESIAKILLAFRA